MSKDFTEDFGVGVTGICLQASQGDRRGEINSRFGYIYIHKYSFPQVYKALFFLSQFFLL